MSKFKQSFLTIAIGIALIAGISYAWTGPTANPPLNNAPAPLNVLGDISGGTQTITDTKTLFMGSGGDKTLGIVGAIWTKGLVQTDGGLLTKGGANKDNRQSVFPFWEDGKNYIRGTTIIADNDEDNRVGIGTNNPQAKLDVNGNVMIGGNKIKMGGSANNYYGDSSNLAARAKDKFYVQNETGTARGTINAGWGEFTNLNIQDGTQGEGKVLTSDVNGNGSWGSYGFGGFYNQNFDGSCRYGNPYTGGACSCPSGFLPAQIDDFDNRTCINGRYADLWRTSNCGISIYQCYKSQ